MANFNDFHQQVGTQHIQVRRDRLVLDAFDKLNNGKDLKRRIQVEFISEQGYAEAGIDGGGLFKEFVDSFSKACYDPLFGLFTPTSAQLITPNPLSAQCLGSDHLNIFYFAGKMLGKAIYERILLESEFAGGFLNMLLGRSNQLDDLFYLDEELYRSLMHLKHYAKAGGELESLELFFETTQNMPTRTAASSSSSSSSSASSSSSSSSSSSNMVTEELIPGGSSIRVNRANIHDYIQRLAYHKQNVQIARQSRAFLEGFRVMVPAEWIRMFSTRELQLLISGDRRAIDLNDLKANVTYASGYHPSQPYVQSFWDIIRDMSPEDQGQFLKFVTSCSRQPLLGFSQLNPQFCIQQVPMHSEGHRITPAQREREQAMLASRQRLLLRRLAFDQANGNNMDVTEDGGGGQGGQGGEIPYHHPGHQGAVATSGMASGVLPVAEGGQPMDLWDEEDEDEDFTVPHDHVHGHTHAGGQEEIEFQEALAMSRREWESGGQGRDMRERDRRANETGEPRVVSSIAAKLPTAATCMNLLKLPKYDSIVMLREKLLYAIRLGVAIYIYPIHTLYTPYIHPIYSPYRHYTPLYPYT